MIILFFYPSSVSNFPYPLSVPLVHLVFKEILIPIYSSGCYATVERSVMVC